MFVAASAVSVAVTAVCHETKTLVRQQRRSEERKWMELKIWELLAFRPDPGHSFMLGPKPWPHQDLRPAAPQTPDPRVGFQAAHPNPAPAFGLHRAQERAPCARPLVAPGCSGVLTNWQGGSSGVPLRTPPQQHHSSSSTSQRAARPPADPDVAKLQLPSGGCCGNREDVMSARCVAALRPLTRPSLVEANEATGQQRGDSQSAWSV